MSLHTEVRSIRKTNPLLGARFTSGSYPYCYHEPTNLHLVMKTNNILVRSMYANAIVRIIDVRVRVFVSSFMLVVAVLRYLVSVGPI